MPAGHLIHVSATVPEVTKASHELVYQVDVTCLSISTLLSYGWVLSYCWSDLQRIDSIMRSYYNREMQGVIFPKRLKESSNARNLEYHRQEIEEYVSIICCFGKLDEQEPVQEWFRLPQLQECLPEGDYEKVTYCSGMQHYDEIEANTIKQMHNVLAQQQIKADDLRAKLQSLANKETKKCLAQREQLTEELEAGEILLAALKHNLNLWEGRVCESPLPPLHTSDLVEEFKSPSASRSPRIQQPKASGSPLQTIRSIASKQLSPSRRNMKAASHLQSSESADKSEEQNPQLRAEGQRVLTLAQMLREQKSYINLRAQMNKN